jgi:prevent-host-death family protein
MAKWTRKSRRWQLQEAKAKFSEVFDKALTEGPQFVTRRGKEEVVLLPSGEYERLLKTTAPRVSLLKLLRSSPAPLSDLDLTRDDDPDRRIPDFSE